MVDASIFDMNAPAITRAEELFAPEIIDLEVANLLRKSVLRGTRDSADATERFNRWIGNDVRRLSHRPYLGTVWALRHNITPYDAAYVAVAMHLDIALITADQRLATAAAHYCEVISAS